MSILELANDVEMPAIFRSTCTCTFALVRLHIGGDTPDLERLHRTVPLLALDEGMHMITRASFEAQRDTNSTLVRQERLELLQRRPRLIWVTVIPSQQHCTALDLVHRRKLVIVFCRALRVRGCGVGGGGGGGTAAFRVARRRRRMAGGAGVLQTTLALFLVPCWRTHVDLLTTAPTLGGEF
eukprot:6188052-Prymnesium_polylepis.1